MLDQCQCKVGKQQFNFWKSIHSNIEQFELAIETQFKNFNSNALFNFCACLPIFIKCLKNKLLAWFKNFITFQNRLCFNRSWIYHVMAYPCTLKNWFFLCSNHMLTKKTLRINWIKSINLNGLMVLPWRKITLKKKQKQKKCASFLANNTTIL